MFSSQSSISLEPKWHWGAISPLTLYSCTMPWNCSTQSNKGMYGGKDCYRKGFRLSVFAIYQRSAHIWPSCPKGCWVGVTWKVKPTCFRSCFRKSKYLNCHIFSSPLQILNLTQALKDGKSPLQLVQMPRVVVERSHGGTQGRIVHLSNAFTQTFHSRKPFFSSW